MEKRAKVGSLVLRNFGSALADSARYVWTSLGEGFRQFPLVSRNMGKSAKGLVTNRDLAIGFGSAVLLHLILVLLFMPKPGSRVKEYELTEQVTLLDQSYPPQAAKVVPRAGLFDAGEVSTENLPSGLAEAQPIDLGRKIDQSQVKVDLNRYAPTGAMTDVIRINKRGEGGGLTTEEILAQAPISLRRAAPQGGGGQMGLFGFPGVGGGVGKPVDLGSAPAVRVAPQQVVRQSSGNQTQLPTGQAPSRTSFTVAGPLKGRQIIAKPVPEYPEWARSRGLTDVQIAMRLEVTPDGSVRSTIILEQSSGYPQWDQACMAALAQWRFAPLAADVQQEVQWGIITFIFRLTM